MQRTRKLLQKALLEAASEKDFAHVMVSDITEKAMVNRATFYRHYKDKYDLQSAIYSVEGSARLYGGWKALNCIRPNR